MNNEIEYLKEHLYEIYKYKKSMKDLTYDMDIEHLLRTCKALDYSQKEIERLKNKVKEIERLTAESTEWESKYYQLQDIIKEAREYINNHQLVFEISSKKQIAYWFDMFYKELLQILDKGE